MKAIVLNEAGGPEKLTFSDLPNPSPTGNQVLVRLKAAALNHVDIWVRQGLPAYPVSFPHIVGGDGAGIVEAVGPDAEGISVGQRVLIAPGISCGQCFYCRTGRDNQCDTFEIVGAKRWGTYAEQVIVPDQNIVPIPDHLNFNEAAAFPLAYLTAWHMVKGRAELRPKENVLVVGAGGGVSLAAVQIASSMGARVLATTTSEEKASVIRRAGADHVFIDRGEEFANWTREKTGGRGVDVLVENVGPATWARSVAAMAKCGRLVTCGATTGPEVPLVLRFLFSRDLTVLGARLGTQRELQELSEAVFSGRIKPIVDRTVPLAKAAEAHLAMEERKQAGKIVLTID